MERVGASGNNSEMVPLYMKVIIGREGLLVCGLLMGTERKMARGKHSG